MNEKIYTIQPAANGYIVVLPEDEPFNPARGLADELRLAQGDMPLPKPERTSRVHVFHNLNDSIAFLKLKIQGDV